MNITIAAILVSVALLGFAYLELLHWRALQQRDAYLLQRDRLDAESTATKAQLEALRSSRNVAVRIHDKRMPSNEVKRAFAVADDAPLWIALNQEIDDYLLDVMDQVSLPPGQTMTEEIRTHVAGGVEYVRGLQKRILELHAAAQKVDVDIEADEANPRQMR